MSLACPDMSRKKKGTIKFIKRRQNRYFLLWTLDHGNLIISLTYCTHFHFNIESVGTLGPTKHVTLSLHMCLSSAALHTHGTSVITELREFGSNEIRITNRFLGLSCRWRRRQVRWRRRGRARCRVWLNIKCESRDISARGGLCVCSVVGEYGSEQSATFCSNSVNHHWHQPSSLCTCKLIIMVNAEPRRVVNRDVQSAQFQLVLCCCCVGMSSFVKKNSCWKLFGAHFVEIWLI